MPSRCPRLAACTPPSLNHAPRDAFLYVCRGRALAIRPGGSVLGHSLYDALGLICPGWRLVGAHGPAVQGPDRMRPSATVRNSVASGQLVGSWTRMRAMYSI